MPTVRVRRPSRTWSLSGVAVVVVACLLSFAVSAHGQAIWEKQAQIPTWKNMLSISVAAPGEFWGTAGALFGQSGDLVHTTDSGQSWEVIPVNGSTLNAVFFLDVQHGWAAGNGFFHTTDGGQTWIQDNNWGSIYDLFFIDAQHGWAAGNGGVAYYTTNGGLSWTGVLTGSATTLSSIWFVDTQVGWAVGHGGQIVKSTDGGKSWSVVFNTGNPATNLSTIQFLSPQEGWAIGGTTFLHTTDGGQSWTSSAVPSGTWSHGARFFDAQHGISVGESGNILRTTDGGQSWSTIQSAGAGLLLWDVEFAGPSTAVACGDNGTMIMTTDGGASWSPIQSGASWTTRGMDAHSEQIAWSANEAGEIGLTTNGGELWERVSVSGFDVYGDLHDIDFADANHGWVVGQNQVFGLADDGRISRSDDGGRTWSLQFSQTAVEFFGVTAIDAQTAIAYGRGNFSSSAYLRTTDGGQTWQGGGPAVNNGFRDACFLADGLTGWLVGNDIHKTTDGGQSWTLQHQGAGPQLSSVSFSDSMNGWASGFANTLLRTTDGGQTWTPKNAGGPAGSAYTGISSTGPNSAWVTGWYGFVAHTDDGGQTWVPHSLPEQVAASAFHEYAVFLSDSYGWVAGNQGIWRYADPTPCPAATTYGQGCVGSNGLVPQLDLLGCTAPGQAITLSISNGLPSSAALLLFGLGAGATPIGGGCSLLVSPVVPITLTLSLNAGGAVALLASIPANAPPGSVTMQAFCMDPSAPLGAAGSAGVKMDIP